MLQTIKQLKGTFNFNLYLEGGASSPDFSEKLKNETNIDDKWIKENKDAIIKFINEKKGEDEFIGLKDFGDDTESWGKIYVILNKIGVTIDENNNADISTTVEKLNSFMLEKKQVEVETKEVTKDLKDETKNLKDEDTKKSIKKVEFSKQITSSDKNISKKDVSKEKNSSKETNISIDIKTFDESKYSVKKYSPEVKKLQEELNKMGANLKVDGLLGNRTKSELAKARKGETLGSKSSTKVEKTQVDSTLIEKASNGELSEVIKNFDPAKDSNDKDKVKELQRELNKYGANLPITGNFGPKTTKAYNEVISLTEKKHIIDSQFTKDSDFGTNEKTDAPLVAEDKTLSQTQEQIKKTGKTLDEMSSRLEATKLLNDQLEKYYFRQRSGYSIEAGLRKIFGEDAMAQIITEKDKYDALMKSPEGKARLERGLEEVLWTKFTDNRDDYGSHSWDSRREARRKEVGNEFLKFAPWIFGLYLGDIPVNINNKLLPGAKINEAKVFQEWIKSGMKQEYKDYLKNHKPEELAPIKEQLTLKDFLSRTNLSKEEQAKILAGDLSDLDSKTEKLLLSYVEHNLIPNMKVLKNESFTVFSYFGRKHTIARNTIKDLEAMVKSGSISGYEKKLSDFFKVIIEEGDVSEGIVGKVKTGDNYMSRISGNNKEIQRQFRGLAELGAEKYNTYNRIFALKNVSDLVKLGASERDKKSLQNLVKILDAKTIDENALNSWEKSNPSALKFVKALGNPDAMLAYQISSIPRSQNLRQLTKSEIEKDTDFNDTHGIRLEGNDNAEDYKIATTTSVDAKSGISTLGFAYKSFVEKAGLVGFSYSEFENAFKSKQKIDIDNFSGQVINTNRNSDGRIGKLTSFEELARKRKDTHVFKMEIDKEYTYYENGKEVTVKASYDLFMRPDCSNPLIVPNTINIQKEGKTVPEGELASLTSVKGKLPVVIPWAVFMSTSTPTPEPNITSIPGHTGTGGAGGKLTGTGIGNVGIGILK